MLTVRIPAGKDQSSQSPSDDRVDRREPVWLQHYQTTVHHRWWRLAHQALGLRSKAKVRKKIKRCDLTALRLTYLPDWHTLCINTHVGTHTGTVLHLDVCRWELRCQCALSKENLTCSVNGAGRGRLAINLIRIEDSNQPLTAALTLRTWPDLWRRLITCPSKRDLDVGLHYLLCISVVKSGL